MEREHDPVFLPGEKNLAYYGEDGTTKWTTYRKEKLRRPARYTSNGDTARRYAFLAAWEGNGRDG